MRIRTIFLILVCLLVPLCASAELELGVMLLMILPAMLRKKLGRWQGITLLCIYAAFCVLQFVL